ncbi:hypothetical protein Tco_1387334 [Tanacetum coccineum]
MASLSWHSAKQETYFMTMSDPLTTSLHSTLAMILHHPLHSRIKTSRKVHIAKIQGPLQTSNKFCFDIQAISSIVLDITDTDFTPIGPLFHFFIS